MIALLAFADKQEESKYHRLVAEHAVVLYRAAVRILKDEQLASDAVQECFLKLFLNLKKLETAGPDKEAAYLMQMLKNAAFDILRKRKREQVVANWEEETLSYGEDEDSLDEILAKTEATELLISELKCLDENERSIIFHRYFNEESFGEIGALLDMKESTVRVRLLRAKKKLAERMREKEGGDQR